MNRQSQTDIILAHLKTGAKLTPRDAFRLFGCLALHSRVAELRARGHLIHCRMVYEGASHWGEYSLAA